MRGISALLPALLLGCSNLTYQKSWKQPPPPESLTGAGTKVLIADARPQWEQKPFRDAISLYALNDTNPSVWEELQRTIASFADKFPERPDRIDVSVQSIQLVAMNSYKLKQETKDRQVDFAPGENAGSSEVFGYLLFGLPMELVVNSLREKRYPDALRPAVDGTTCSLKADVTITWPDGRRKTIPVFAQATTDHPGEHPQNPLGEALRLAMLSVNEQLRDGVEASGTPRVMRD